MLEFSKYNKISGIYKWENKINHKCYIGQSVDLGSRLRHHINNYKHHRYDAPLYRAFDKYGLDSFEVKILYQFDEYVDGIKYLLDRLEIACIELYNSYGKRAIIKLEEEMLEFLVINLQTNSVRKFLLRQKLLEKYIANAYICIIYVQKNYWNSNLFRMLRVILNATILK